MRRSLFLLLVAIPALASAQKRAFAPGDGYRLTTFSSPAVSPDGRLVAYNSNQSGRHEVYVQDFPEPQERWQISSSGGAEPYWRADGRELYFRTPDGKVQAVPIKTTPRFEAGNPEPLFQGRFPGLSSRGRFEPTPDGQRFLVLYSMSRETLTPTTVVLNWTSLLGN